MYLFILKKSFTQGKAVGFTTNKEIDANLFRSLRNSIRDQGGRSDPTGARKTGKFKQKTHSTKTYFRSSQVN